MNDRDEIPEPITYWALPDPVTEAEVRSWLRRSTAAMDDALHWGLVPMVQLDDEAMLRKAELARIFGITDEEGEQ